MKTKIIAIGLFVFTAAAVAFYPLINSAKPVITKINPMNSQQPKIEAVFVLDTTGSMAGLIQAAKEKVWSIANTMASAQPAPEIKIGLVAYRDRGDDYITRVIDLSSDLDSMYAQLMDFQAGGGGDGPESVNQALYDAVHHVSWSQNQDSYKVIFLVGDAPPHMDYQDDIKYPQTIAVAKQRGIVVNAVQCGEDGSTTPVWQQLAQLGSGRYFQVEQSGSAVAITTPFDAKIAELSAELDDTRLYYGSRDELAVKQAKMKATEKLNAESSISSRARRGVFNSSAAGAANFAGDKELVEDIASGRVDLSEIDKDALPATLKPMAPAEQEAFVQKNIEKRQKLQAEIKQLAGKRDEFIADEVKKSGGAEDSLDVKIYDAVREQAADKGLKYEAAAPAY